MSDKVDSFQTKYVPETHFGFTYPGMKIGENNKRISWDKKMQLFLAQQ